jgi:NodT family efflux transporter outer membrane factor (OMF) lipoprotein
MNMTVSSPCKKLTLICVALLLAGCTSMSGIEPHAKIADAHRLDTGKIIARADAISWPDEQWWKAYRDPQLDALIAKTISDSPTLRAATMRVARSSAFADRMRAETRPHVSSDTSIAREKFTSRQFIPPPWGGNSDWNNKTQISFAYDLDLWARQKSIWQASVDESHAAAAEVQMIKLELVTAVIHSYVQLSMQFELRDIAAEQQRQQALRVDIARRNLAAGLGTELEVSEIETPLPQARARVESIDERILLLRNQIAVLSGQAPGAGDHLVRPTLTPGAAIGLPDQLPANLIGRRPDIQACRWHIEAAQNNIEGAKAAFYPNINLIAFAGFQAIGFAQLIGSGAAIAGVGPAISLPIFDGGRRRSNLTEKTTAYDDAVENYNAQMLHALQEISDQLVILQSNAGQLTEAEKGLSLAQKSHTLAQASYRAGLDDYQHVLNARFELLRQQETIAARQAVQLYGYADLMRALGGGAGNPASLTH